jgi:hypothetical protein
MGKRTDHCAYLFVGSLAALSAWSSACDYDDGGFPGATPIDVVRDAAPPTRDTRGSTPATDASSGLGATSVKPPDAAASPPDAGAAPAADAGAVDGAAPPPDAPAPTPPAGPPAACASPAALPVTFRRVGQGPRSDDFSFDRDGHLIAFDGMNFVRVPRLGSVEVLARDAIGSRGGGPAERGQRRRLPGPLTA